MRNVANWGLPTGSDEILCATKRSRSGHLWKGSVALLFGIAVSYPLAAQVDAIFTINGPGNARVCLGDGSGGFSCSNIGQDTSAIGALGDVDGDGKLDAVFVDSSLLVCLGDGEGGFSCFDSGGAFSGPIDVALGFVDGDSHLDVVVAVVGGPAMKATTGSGGPAFDQVCLGDGNGGFSCSQFGIAAYSQGVALGFVDNDSFLDAVFARNPPEVCLGDGSGGFSCSGINMVGSAREVALGNVNGDANLDAIFARPDPSNIVCLGDGNGGFSCSDVNGDGGATDSVALGLVNSDDIYLDAVFAESSQPNRVCLGDGNGGFSCSDVSTDLTENGQVALGLVDDDAFLDAMFAGSQTPPLLCLGNGSGGFSCSDVQGATNISYNVLLGDLNTQPRSFALVPTLGPAALTMLVILIALLGVSRVHLRQEKKGTH